MVRSPTHHGAQSAEQLTPLAMAGAKVGRQAREVPLATQQRAAAPVGRKLYIEVA